jgi:hypothetical protein
MLVTKNVPQTSMLEAESRLGFGINSQGRLKLGFKQAKKLAPKGMLWPA